MPREVREAEVRTLAERLNDEFVPQRRPRRELAVEVDRHLTRYIAGITGQRVRTSAEVRGFALSKLAFPFALGACDALSGDVAIFKDTGPLEPHVLAHEFSHRKGYWKELPAQVLAYLALVTSGEPVLRQAARLERFYRHLRVLAGKQSGAFERLAAAAALRPELGHGARRAPAARDRGRAAGRSRDAAGLRHAHADDRAGRHLRLRRRLHELPLHVRDQHDREADAPGPSSPSARRRPLAVIRPICHNPGMHPGEAR